MGGKLNLKGNGGIEKKKKKKKRERELMGRTDIDDELEIPEWSDAPLPGTGELITSGVVVMGKCTAFDEELEVGDSLLVSVVDKYRNTTTDESRVVNMVLGKSSLNLAQPFTCDVSTPSRFMFVKKPPDVEALRAAHAQAKERAKHAEEQTKEITYKVYKNGTGPWASWKTVTEKVSSSVSRENMLDKRSKMKADRFCK